MNEFLGLIDHDSVLFDGVLSLKVIAPCKPSSRTTPGKPKGALAITERFRYEFLKLVSIL